MLQCLAFCPSSELCKTMVMSYNLLAAIFWEGCRMRSPSCVQRGDAPPSVRHRLEKYAAFTGNGCAESVWVPLRPLPHQGETRELFQSNM